jgi:hypothetical protein
MLERGFYDRVIVDYFFDLKVQSDFVDYLFRARSIATAIATVAPTIGLLPIPRKPIIST